MTGMAQATSWKELLGQEPVDAYLQMERYWNDGSPSGFRDTVSHAYAAQSAGDFFSLPIYVFSGSKFLQIGDIPFQWSRLGQTPEEGALVPIHPDVRDVITAAYPHVSQEPIFHIPVAPCANGRTVLLVHTAAEPIFIKLHYPKVLGRFTRKLSLNSWIAGLENSRELLEIQPQLTSSVAFLYEVAGVFAEGLSQTAGFGVIYREFRPRPRNVNHVLVPAFALFATEHLASTREALLVQILRDRSEPRLAFLSEYIEPLLRSFIELACNYGLIPTYHAQNVLFEIDRSSFKARLVVRDMGDLYKDLTLRRELGLHTIFCRYNTLERENNADYWRKRSFLYDFKLGEYLLRPLITCFADGMGFDVTQVMAQVREMARELWAQYQGYFGSERHWYAYPRQRDLDEHTYIELENPIFR